MCGGTAAGTHNNCKFIKELRISEQIVFMVHISTVHIYGKQAKHDGRLDGCSWMWTRRFSGSTGSVLLRGETGLVTSLR
jgi:hypothetical protein